MSGNLFKLRKDWPIPPNNNNNNYSYCYYSKTSLKDRTPGPWTTNHQFNRSTKGREVWMGTKLLHLQKHRGRLGWWPPEAVPAATTSPDAVLPDPKLPEAPEFPENQVTDIWYSWYALKPIKTSQRMGRRNGKAQQQIWSWLLFRLWTWLRIRWQRRVQIWT